MTEAEYHQQTLEQRQQVEEAMAKKVKQGVLCLPFNQKVGLVSECESNTFMIVDFGLRHYKVTIEEV